MNFHRSKKILLSDFHACFPEGWTILKTGIFGNCVFATFSKNIKHLTFAGCQSEIPLNSSQLLSIPYESEVLLPICYQIFDDVLGRCQGVIYKKRVWHLMEYLGRNETNYFMYQWAAPIRSPHPSELLHLSQACV